MLYGNILDSLIFENHNGETLSVRNLKFIISDIQFTETNGDLYTTSSEYSIFKLTR